MSVEREEGKAGTPEDWLQIARSDLNLARIARSAEGVLPEQVAFHAQQCAEKSLKSVMVFHGVHFPPTHSLQALIDLCISSGLEIPQFMFKVISLTPYAVKGRYMELPEVITEDDLDEALQIAASVLAWAETQIKI